MVIHMSKTDKNYITDMYIENITDNTKKLRYFLIINNDYDNPIEVIESVWKSYYPGDIYEYVITEMLVDVNKDGDLEYYIWVQGVGAIQVSEKEYWKYKIGDVYE